MPALPERARQEPGSVFAERDRIDRLSHVRDIVFGSLDGLVVPLGVVSGVAGGIGDSRAVIVAGIAEAFAGALSMAAGEFIASRSEAQVQQTEVRKELAEMRDAPKYELTELAHIYEQEGMSAEDAKQLVTTLARYPRVYEKAMVAQELGIPTLEPETAKLSGALTIGISYIVGSIFPLVAYFFFPIPVAFPLSLVLTLVALVVVGIIKGKLASMNLTRSIVEIVLVGALSAGGGYVLGTLLPTLLGY